MKRKLVVVLIVFTLLVSVVPALADSMSQEFKAQHIETSYDGQFIYYNTSVAIVNFNYAVQETPTEYLGAVKVSMSSSGGTYTVRINISTIPDFNAPITNNGKKLTVTYSGGSIAIYHHNLTYIDENGVRETKPDVACWNTQFNVSRVYNK